MPLPSWPTEPPENDPNRDLAEFQGLILANLLIGRSNSRSTAPTPAPIAARLNPQQPAAPTVGTSSSNDMGRRVSFDDRTSYATDTYPGTRLNILNILSNHYLRTSRRDTSRLHFHPRIFRRPFENDFSDNNERANERTFAAFDNMLSMTYSEDDETYLDDDEDDDDDSEMDDDEYIDDHPTDPLVYDETAENTASNPSFRLRRVSTNLRNEILANEQFLLSSANQNYNERSGDLNPFGVPLQRQNAIRVRSRPLAKEISEGVSRQHESAKRQNFKSIKSALNSEARSLLAAISKIKTSLVEMPGFQGESPLFCKKDLTLMKNFSNMFFSKRNISQADDLMFPDLEIIMDEFLHLRRHGLLTYEKDAPPMDHREEGDIKSSIGKRKRDTPDFPYSKKQKTTSTSYSEDMDYFIASPLGPFEDLSKYEKDQILGTQFCSWFKSGTTFAIELEHVPHHSDLTFSSVNYENKTIEGVFQINGISKNGDPPVDIFLRLIYYKQFFTGFNESTWNYPKNTIFLRKLLILERLKNDKLIRNSIKSQSPELEVNIPVHGKILDFTQSDLRFLSSNKSDHTGSCSLLSKNESIRLQLLEWMRFNPFKQFRETYFFSYINELQNNLGSFSKTSASRIQKQEAINLARDFKSNVDELTKDFSYVESKKEPYKNETRNYFLNDWERSMSHCLSENLTDQTSSTLLNVQLNYILFTLNLDVSKFLVDQINFILDNVKKDHALYVEKYKAVLNKVLQDESLEDNEDFRKVSLLCSLNRKTGTLEVHNTLPCTHYKSELSRRKFNIRGVDFGVRWGRVVDDFEQFPDTGNTEDSRLLSLCLREFGQYFDPYEYHVVTELYGRIKPVKEPHTLGGGNQTFDFT